MNESETFTILGVELTVSRKYSDTLVVKMFVDTDDGVKVEALLGNLVENERGYFGVQCGWSFVYLFYKSMPISFLTKQEALYALVIEASKQGIITLQSY